VDVVSTRAQEEEQLASIIYGHQMGTWEETKIDDGIVLTNSCLNCGNELMVLGHQSKLFCVGDVYHRHCSKQARSLMLPC